MRKNPSSRDSKPGGDKPYKKDTGNGSRSGDKKPFKRDSGESSDKPRREKGKPFEEHLKRAFRDDKPRNEFDNDRPKRSYTDRDDKPKRDFGKSDRPKRSFDKDDRPKRTYGDRDDKPKRDFGNSDRPKRSFDKDDRPKRSYGDRDDTPKRDFDKSDRPKRSFDKDDRPKRTFDDKGKGKPKFTVREQEENPFDKPYPLGTRKVSGPFRKQFEKEQKEKADKPYKGRPRKEEKPQEVKEMTLNKYIAHSGKCSRRDAAEMVKQGKVKVNNELMLDPGYRVQPYDIVTIAGKKLTPQKGRVYILLNKPKGYITTTEDPEGRRTIMDLVDDAGPERLFPVGRLDRNTTGLILLTNDGDLAQKLSHPSYEIKKVYQATLNKDLTKAHFDAIVNGLKLDDGEVHVDALAYLDNKNELGLEIHSGRNRIVRRIFESLGYEVEKLDRVMYAGLTKKNLPRGHWRPLEEKEIILLKHFKS
jgi:23S rRNA pseudouridine2605 synthase